MLRINQFLLFVSLCFSAFLFQNCQYSSLNQLSMDALEEDESLFTFAVINQADLTNPGKSTIGLNSNALKINSITKQVTLYDNCTDLQTPVDTRSVTVLSDSGDVMLLGSTLYFRMKIPAEHLDSCNMPLIDFTCIPQESELAAMVNLLIYNFDESISQATMIMRVPIPSEDNPNEIHSRIIQMPLFIRNNTSGFFLSLEPNGASHSDILTLRPSLSSSSPTTARSFEAHFIGPYPSPNDPARDILFQCRRNLAQPGL